MDYLVSKQKVRYDGRCMHKPTSYFVIAGKSSSPHSVTPAELTRDVNPVNPGLTPFSKQRPLDHGKQILYTYYIYII